VNTLKQFNIGDEVYWNDPEDGLCSAYYTIAELYNDDIVLLVNGYSETEAFIHELS
jgi:hypothetical protein